MNYRYRYATGSISFGGPLTPTVKRIIIACVVVFVMQILSGGLRGPITALFSLTRPWCSADSTSGSCLPTSSCMAASFTC